MHADEFLIDMSKLCTDCRYKVLFLRTKYLVKVK